MTHITRHEAKYRHQFIIVLCLIDARSTPCMSYQLVLSVDLIWSYTLYPAPQSSVFLIKQKKRKFSFVKLLSLINLTQQFIEFKITMKTSFNFLIQSKMLLLCISLIIFPSSESFSAFPTAFHNNICISTFSSPSTTNLKMGLVENIPTIMDNDISTIFRTLSDLALDIGTAVVSPEETGCIKLIESIGQGFGLLSYCASHQCI